MPSIVLRMKVFYHIVEFVSAKKCYLIIIITSSAHIHIHTCSYFNFNINITIVKAEPIIRTNVVLKLTRTKKML